MESEILKMVEDKFIEKYKDEKIRFFVQNHVRSLVDLNCNFFNIYSGNVTVAR